MSGSMRAESALNSLDGSNFSGSYSTGQRGAYSGTSLERSASFRESLGASRNAAQPAEIPSVSQYLALESILLSEQKYTRSNELRRVLGVSLEEQHSFGSIQSKSLPPIASEELKRFKVSLQETSSRARDRAKLLNEFMLKVDKYRNILLKKRQRNEVLSSEKPGSTGLLKTGGQIHQSPMDIMNQRLEGRTKLGVPNRRVRSSITESEGRGTVSPRPGTFMDKDKNMPCDNNKLMPRASNGTLILSEDKVRGLPVGENAWEKKMKRKRSVGTMVKTPDGDRDLKQAIQQRPSELRSRSCDGLGYRPGSSTGVTGSNKMDPSSQLTGASSRIMPRSELDSVSLQNDRRDRTAGPDKEHVAARGSNKINMREDVQVGIQSPLTKVKGCRAPRSGSGALINTPNFAHPSSGVDGGEPTPCLNKFQPPAGAANRKRPLLTGPSSSPVTQWGVRPLKSSRTRRAYRFNPVSIFDEAQILPDAYAAPDAGARVTTSESSGLLPSRGISNNSNQLKLKPDNVPSPALISESEESGAIENKSKDKVADNADVEDGSLNVVGSATFGFPPKKNKVTPKEEMLDVARRQGRNGRGSIQSKVCLPVAKEKLETVDITNPFKNGRPNSDKSESKVGRPPKRKASDRKTHVRPAQIANGGCSELTCEADDDREELLASASSARNASFEACSGTFWKTIEPYFNLTCSEDITYVKNQISFAEDLDGSPCNVVDADRSLMIELPCQAVSSFQSSCGGSSCTVDESRAVKTVSGILESERWFGKIIPLSQILLSAFIAEDGTDDFDCSMESMDQGDTAIHFSNDYFSNGTSTHVEIEQERDHMKSNFGLGLDFPKRRNMSYVNPCNGYTVTSKTRSPNIHNLSYGDQLYQENGVPVNTETMESFEFGQTNSDRLRLMGTSYSGDSPDECQFEHMPLEDKILIELHSIGIFPETVPDLADGEHEEISKTILELQMRLYQQVREKKNQLHVLEKSIQDGKEVKERKLERLAMNKLIETAYKRLMGGRGSIGSSHKSGGSKASKQLAMAFAKRTLTRCRKFEETGRSSFNETVFRDALFSEPAKCLDGISPGTAANTRSSQVGSLLSASDAVASGLTSTTERGKKREVLLDNVVTSSGSRATSTLSHVLPGSAKWKRSDRDREQDKDALPKNSYAKIGRPTLGNGRGERKTKTKPKQKIAQLSTSGNGLGRVTETTNVVLPKLHEPCETLSNHSNRVNQEAKLPTQDLSKELEDSIFSNLPLHGMDPIDEFDVPDGLGGQGQDIASWLNVDEEALQDHDLMGGLEIPMDDLSELKLNF